MNEFGRQLRRISLQGSRGLQSPAVSVIQGSIVYAGAC